MYRRGFLALSIAVATGGCLEYVRNGDGEEIVEPADLEVVWHDLVRDDPGTEDERVAVWGAVRNVGDRTLSYLEIRATFYDDEGEQLDSVIENVSEDVSSGAEWAFEVEFPHFGEEAAAVRSYELDPATGV